MKKSHDPLIKASNALAFQARQLRKAATDPDAVVSQLHSLGMKHTMEVAERKQAARAEAVASIQPMIERARQQLADADEARAEAKTFVRKFANVNWDALRDRFNAWDGATPENPVSTRDRIAQVRAAVEELASVAGAGDEDLRRCLSAASALQETESHSARYAINDLYHRMSLSADSGQAIRNRIKAIRRHLEAIGTVLMGDVSNDALRAQEEK